MPKTISFAVDDLLALENLAREHNDGARLGIRARAIPLSGIDPWERLRWSDLVRVAVRELIAKHKPKPVAPKPIGRKPAKRKAAKR